MHGRCRFFHGSGLSAGGDKQLPPAPIRFAGIDIGRDPGHSIDSSDCRPTARRLPGAVFPSGDIES
jgi:hypothetical protein